MVDRLENQVEKEERDLNILREVIAHGPIGIVKLSEETGLPEHKVRYSLRMLENDGFIEPTPDGAVPVDDIEERIEHVNERGRRAGHRRAWRTVVDFFPGRHECGPRVT